VHFATDLPWWGLALIGGAVLALALIAYRRVGGFGFRRRATLGALRAGALGLVVLCLLRPMVRANAPAGDGVVAVLVDHSRSMGLEDAGGTSRIERAGAIVRSLVPALARRWTVETWLFGDGLRDARDVALAATADKSDLGGAVTSAVSRLSGRGVAGVVIVSDGARTDSSDLADVGRQLGVPVIAIGVGSADAPDLAVRTVTTGEPRLDASLVDLTVTAESRGLSGPFDLRLLQNGRVVERRTLTPRPEGGPLRETFTVAPDRDAPTVFTLDIPRTEGELTAGNNRMSVLVPPPGRRRRVLVLEGSPGFEHTFLTRALSEDPSLDVDTVVRKGRDERGDDTYFVQAAGARAAALAGGFPSSREGLDVYDAVVLANFDVRLLPGDNLEWLREFVGVRGGGLLVLGARSFDSQALSGAAIEDVLPLRPSDGGGIVPVVATTGGDAEHVRVTSEGARHPLMRVAAGDEEALKRWAGLPPLAGHVRLGAPRPGASVLAVADGPAGTSDPVVAIQRFGAGRAMVFAGEASWRWKMLLPAGDGTYSRFWRQAVRWLAVEAPDGVQVAPPAPASEGDEVDLVVEVRDAQFRPAADLAPSMRLEGPDGVASVVTPTLVDPARGRFMARVPAGEAGVHRAHVEAARGGTALGSAEVPWLTGGFDRELADPRLDEFGLRRLADASGGAYLTPERAGEAEQYLQARAARGIPVQWRDAWHTVWMLVLIVALVSAEWILRRQWGLR
jgi:uncharacterized membrane protein